MLSELEKQRLTDLIALDNVMGRLEKSYNSELTAGDYERFASLKKQVRFLASIILIERYARDTPLLREEQRLSSVLEVMP